LAELHTFRDTGAIVAATSTRPESTADVLRLMIDECVRLQREPVPARELRGAQDFVAGNFPIAVEAPASLAAQLLDEVFYGLDPRDLGTYRDRVGRVTAGDVQRVARQFLTPDDFAIVLVGDAAAFTTQLRSLGFTEFERVPVAELDLSSPTFRRGS